jgi:hypothetical protein
VKDFPDELLLLLLLLLPAGFSFGSIYDDYLSSVRQGIPPLDTL